MMYSSHNCHFCKSTLIQAREDRQFYYCDCYNMYSALVYNTGRFSVIFRCGDIKFNISDFQTRITDTSPRKSMYDWYEVSEPLYVDNDNYLQVIERVKKLQAFK